MRRRQDLDTGRGIGLLDAVSGRGLTGVHFSVNISHCHSNLSRRENKPENNKCNLRVVPPRGQRKA